VKAILKKKKNWRTYRSLLYWREAPAPTEKKEGGGEDMVANATMIRVEGAASVWNRGGPREVRQSELSRQKDVQGPI